MGKKPLLALTVLGLGLAFTGCQNPKPAPAPFNQRPTFSRNDPAPKQDTAVGKQDGGGSGPPATATNVAAPGAAMQTPPSWGRNPANTPAPGGAPSLTPPTGHAPQDGPAPTQPTSFAPPGSPTPVPPPPLGTIQQTNRPVVVDPAIHDVPSTPPMRTDTGLGRPPAVPPSDNLLDHPGQPLPAIDGVPARVPQPPPAPLPVSDLGSSAPQPGAGPTLPPPPLPAPAPAQPGVPPLER
jgi:hypothetical protein